MLSGQGWTAVAGCRQFFYARYIDWMITFPLITVLLGFIAGSEWSVILGAIGAQGTCTYNLYLPVAGPQGNELEAGRSLCTVLTFLGGVSFWAVIQLFAQYMGSVSTVSAVKWLWFLINVTALAGVLVHLARVFKAGADAKGGEVAQLYGEIMPSVWPSFSNQHVKRCESFSARAFSF